MTDLNLPSTYDDAARAVFASALAIVQPPREAAPKPRKFDKFNSTLRFLALNAIESQKFPAGSRGRAYSDEWLQAKSLEVVA